MGYWDTVGALDEIRAAQAIASVAVPAIDNPRREISNAVYGLIPGMVTPDGALDHMRQVDRQVAALHAEVIRLYGAGRLELAFANEWQRFADSWRAFYNDNSGFSPRFWGASEIDERTGAFQRETEAFYKRIAELTGKPPSMLRPFDYAPPDKGFSLGPTGLALAGVGGIVALAMLIGAIKK